MGRRHAGLIERIDEFGVRHCVVPGVNTSDPQSDFNRGILCRNARIDVMWPGVEIGRTWHYKCGSCGTAYYCKGVKVNAGACARCGGGWIEPDWSARKRLQNLLDSGLNSNGERMKDMGELLTQNLLDVGEAYLTRSGNYRTDESGTVSEEPVELNEPERRMSMQGVLDYWVPTNPVQFVRTVNEWQHLLGLPSNVMFCVYHRSKAYVGKSECPECGKRMIDAYGYTRVSVPGDGHTPHNDVSLKYFGEKEVLGYGGWHRQIEADAGHKTDNYKYLANYSHVGVDTVNSIRTLLNEKFFGPLAESIVGRDTGFTLEVPLAVDESQESKVLNVIAQYAEKGYRHQLLPDGIFMIATSSGESDNSV